MTTDPRHRRRVARLACMLIPLAALAGCQRESASPVAVATAAATPPRVATLAAQPWSLPAPAGASQPDLSVSPQGDVLLSWVEKETAQPRLRFARFAAGRWSEPLTIASDEWFGNTSDTPHLRATPDGALWAQWLRKSTVEGHARDVVLARSGDGGVTWSRPVLVNQDATPTEHGFVSMWAVGADRLGMAWLDGRHRTAGHGKHDKTDKHAMHRKHAAQPEPGAHAEGDAPANMTMLRSAVFDAALQRSGETAVDTSACDCCQTDTAATPDGPLVVYRDRTAQEVRDIAVTRLRDGAWTAPRIVHADGWTMPACPVNGPAVASTGANVSVGWYTAVGDVATIRAAVSTDAGDRFGAPLEIDRGPAILGRVDVAVDAQGTWLTWLREEQAGQTLWLARIAQDGSRIEQRQRIASLQGRGRGTGVPKALIQDGRLHVVWTDVADGAPRLDGGVYQLRMR